MAITEQKERPVSPVNEFFNQAKIIAGQLIEQGKGASEILAELDELIRRVNQRLFFLDNREDQRPAQERALNLAETSAAYVAIPQISSGTCEALLKATGVIPSNKTLSEAVAEMRRLYESRLVWENTDPRYRQEPPTTWLKGFRVSQSVVMPDFSWVCFEGQSPLTRLDFQLGDLEQDPKGWLHLGFTVLKNYFENQEAPIT